MKKYVIKGNDVELLDGQIAELMSGGDPVYGFPKEYTTGIAENIAKILKRSEHETRRI